MNETEMIYENRVNISIDPMIFTISNFISSEECQHIINISRSNVQRALVSQASKGSISDGRSGKVFWLNHDHDDVTKSIGNKIANVVGIPLNKAEAFQVIYYDKNQEYAMHCDGWLHDGSEKSIRCMKYGGQRLRTALCYLNNVEEGGETRFTKLNYDVKPEPGKLLVFSNVKGTTNLRNSMSEHAGRPVIRGEKWAFNLWFREENRRTIVYDPKKNLRNSVTESIVDTMSEHNTIIPMSNDKEEGSLTINYREISNYTFLQIFDNAITDNMILKDYLQNFKFRDQTTRNNFWLKNHEHPAFIEYIENLTRTDKNLFENICLVQYPPKHVHGRHLDAFDNARLQRETRGQRTKTITGFLDSGFVYIFPESGTETFKELECKKDSIIVYNNVYPETLIRDKRYIKTITNTQDKHCFLFHIFLRERVRKVDLDNNSVFASPAVETSDSKFIQIEEIKSFSDLQETKKNQISEMSITNENFKECLNEVYKMAYTNTLSKKGFRSLTFSNIKTSWTDVIDTIRLIDNERVDDSILNLDLLQHEYVFDEYTPCIVNNCIQTKVLQIIQKYVQRNIDNGSYPLGDKQSYRFKTIDDPINRILHFEMLPLIEKITGEILKPTYTYLSCYLNQAGKCTDLPAHTDRREAYITVSFILSKPEGSHWAIYFHKVKQPTKNKGRWDGCPISKEDCVSCDCDAGGFMIFKGEDHNHFREEMNCDYYNIILLHYVKLE